MQQFAVYSQCSDLQCTGYKARGHEAEAKPKLLSNHEAEAEAEALNFWKHEAEAEALAFSKYEAEAEAEAEAHVLPSYHKNPLLPLITCHFF